MADFKFSVGELVYFRAGIADCLGWARLGRLQLPTLFVVTQQISDTCSAGTQLGYLVSRDGKVLKVQENEIVVESEWDFSFQLKTYSENRSDFPEDRS